MSRLYEFILFDKNGTPVADISKIAQNRSYAMQRNRAEELSFDIPLTTFERFAAQNGLDPRDMLEPLNTEVKVRRNGVWKFGTTVGESPIRLTGNDMTVSVRCFGYLDLLADRYVTPEPFYAVDGVDIAWELIDLTQSKTNGDLGITQGASQTITQARDRTDYRYQNVKDAIVNLAKLSDYPFDFEFTHDKQFNTYAQIGADQSNRLIIYPGNIIELYVPRTGMKTYNYIYALGSGFDADQIATTSEDATSQINLIRRERVQTWNSVENLSTLQQNADGYLDDHKRLLEIPQFTMSGKHFDLNTYGIGDRLNVQVEGYNFINPSSIQRVERLEVTIDSNDAEQVKVYFDTQEDTDED